MLNIQQTDNDTGIDTDPNGSWFEIHSILKQGGSIMCVLRLFFWLITIMIVHVI